ncbi:tRNA (adenosine(37)-N6)-threonylcarbamoyltransferase complex dimerization subunit type 1 TsaB [Litorivita pollutaquae]|uniref:tRNA (Adenosine(37)-N6)-threonylcarbamoyltransferase complex dimerization subunit type 1 TsaB n=1 Tax=Litorivita pollutaquae TaxID=2200892 RepID=A0A2V4NNC0_9RHOB|nr:tRNA (adenosine(37)-N6)-threonylcarbamoyltransferase complex dimerization subunit type 1 TsaB [Litorivita pollutaquae]PYC47857.1 tRNA (adenosine(37)-N6)-threonylcarbamoyltransferase complex dimerization subunit type 1 TsaB [Litorivita pollutaquae]
MTLILGFDTSAAHCAAALLDGDTLLESCAEEMSRGQAERLMGLLEELLARHAKTWADLDAIGVGIGPGNFTGIRISVSAARGLALALPHAPAIGISTFEAIAVDTNPSDTSGKIPAVPAPRDQLYVAQSGRTPVLLPRSEAEGLGPLALPAVAAQLAENIARAAAVKHATGGAWPAPAPLYIRAADAAPPRDPAPHILP